MYRLYWSPGSAAMAPHAMLAEIGAPYELVHVDVRAGAHRQADYLRLNPNARVPTLIVDGMAMSEAAAICMLLAERHPEAGLAPPLGSPARAPYLQWLTHLTNTVQERFVQWFHPDWHLDGEDGQAALKAGAAKELAALFDRIDARLAANGPHLAGERASVPDLYLAMLVRWSRFQSQPGWTRPHVRRCVEAVVARPGFQRMLAEEGIAWPS